MNFANKLLFFFSFLGAFNGLIAGIYFLFFTAKKHLSNYFLGALLLALSLRVGKSVAYFFDYNLSKTLLQAGLTACCFIGPFLYFYLKVETKQIRKLPVSWMWQLTAWLVVIVMAGIIYPYENFPKLWPRYIIPLIYLQWGVYICFSIVLIKPLLQKIARREPLKPYEKWMLTICGMVTSIYIAYAWAFLGITKGSYIAGPLCFSIILYVVILTLLYRKKANDLSSFATLKYGDRKLDDEETQLIIVRLKKAMGEKQLYRNPNLKVGDLAREIKVPAHQLSRILNDNLQKSFTIFVNEYRINEACNMLSGDTNLTVEAIGDEVGFNSRSTFYAAFKKIKGLSPNAYQQAIIPDL